MARVVFDSYAIAFNSKTIIMIMSNFNPKYNNLTPIEWSHRALENSTDNKSSFIPIIGLVVGILAASTTGFPPTGLLVFAWAVYEALKRNNQMGRNELAITQYGCVAHCLSSDDFRDFRAQVGDEEVLRQLQWARNNNYRLSEIAEDYLEAQPMPRELIGRNTRLNAVNAEVVPVVDFDREDKSVVTSNIPFTPINDKPTQLIEFKTEIPDLPKLLAQSLKLTLIVGVPGSGKGIFVTNALSAVKQYHKNTTVFYIDPKNDPKETAYFSGRVDKLFRKDLMTTEPEDAEEWIRNCLAEYERFDCGEGRKLLVFDELGLTLKTLAAVKVEKGIESPLVWFKRKLSGYATSGDSRGVTLWGISQNAHVSGLGMDGGERTMFIPIFIIDARNVSASVGILKAQMIPGDKRLNSVEIQQLCKKSEIGRAIYFGGTNQWYPLPKLENYSGFDRDNRTFLPGFTPTPESEKLVVDYDAVMNLENSFKLNSPEVKSPTEIEFTDSQELSEAALLVLSFFDNAKIKNAKSIKELKDANKLRQLDYSMILMALRELVVKKWLTFDEQGRYLKQEWQ